MRLYLSWLTTRSSSSVRPAIFPLLSSWRLNKLRFTLYACLVRAASLNYRDLIIVQGMYPFPQRDGVVPCSDGAGEVVQVGKSVVRFKVGDSVLTLFNQTHQAGPITIADHSTGVGGVVDGSLREYGSYDEDGLVHMPKNLNFEEGATLTCAGLTAWNALYGIESKSVKPGDWVLTQGTGGVSIFALQVHSASYRAVPSDLAERCPSVCKSRWSASNRDNLVG